MRSRDVFGLGGGQGYNFLAFSTPQNGAAVQKKSVPRNRTAILRHAAVRIRVPHQFPPGVPIRQPQPCRTLQVAKDSLHGVPVLDTGVSRKL